MAKRKGKFIQHAREEMERKGTVGSYGHHSRKQMKRDIGKGGKIGKKANFALNMSRIAKRKKSGGRRRGGRRR